MGQAVNLQPRDKMPPSNHGTHRQIALQEFRAFLSGPILDYAKKRNFDYGYSDNQHVSRLSKYVSHRIISEYELISSVLSQYKYPKVEKFIQEIFWRIYWKEDWPIF